MCQECARDYGPPVGITPEIQRAADLVAVIYEENVTGTPLHAELDDWNIEYTPWAPWEPARQYVSPEVWAAAEEMCSLANRMTLAERNMFLMLAHGKCREGQPT